MEEIQIQINRIENDETSVCVCVCVCDGQTEQKSADGIGPDWPVMIQLP
jgi:hypothetical protein